MTIRHTSRGDMWATAHLKQFQCVTVVGHQDFKRWVINWRVINLE